MKKIVYTALGLFSVYLLFMWDYHVSKIIFDRICSDPDQVGLTIYERQILTSEFTTPIPSDHNPQTIPEHLFINDSEMLNMTVFNEHFSLDRFKVINISKIGPVEKLQTTITRKSDGRVLSRASNIENGMGWINRLFTGGYGSQHCPREQEKNSNGLSNNIANHHYLVRETFLLE